MKTTIVAVMLLLSSIFTQAQFSSANLTAAGLTCAMCTRAIYKALEKIPFVNKVDADINNSSFNITFRENAMVDPDALKKAVEDAGFSVAQLKLTGQFGNIALKNDSHLTIGGKMFHFVGANGKLLHGNVSLKMVDKDYLTAKEFKKYRASTSYACIETGRAGNCCAKDGVAANSRIYHVTL